MKASIHFNLDNKEDAMKHMRCIKSLSMAIAIWDIRKELEQALDTSENGLTISGISFLEKFNEILAENNLNLDELIN